MKTTKADFELFCKECYDWVKYFNLEEYEIVFKHTKIDGAYADTCTDAQSHQALIRLNVVWPESPTELTIRQTAFHEVIELLLGRLRCFSSSRFVLEREIDEAVHGVIMRLQNTVFRQKYSECLDKKNQEKIKETTTNI